MFGSGGDERIVGVYNCDRFDLDTGDCRDYETEPRLSFCENAGIRVSPHSKCLLKSKESDEE